MAENTQQNYANHTRWDPPFHFFVIPVFMITVIVNIWNLIQSPFSFSAVWMVIFSIAVVVAGLKIRLYALKVQDRVIRLEERLRCATLVSEPIRSRIGELTEGQCIALRFASDAELPALVEKTLAGKLAGKEIKQNIANWRPDYFRI